MCIIIGWLGGSRQGIKLSMEVKASAEVTAEDIQNGLTRLRAAELSIGGKMHGVDSATYITQGITRPPFISSLFLGNLARSLK